MVCSDDLRSRQDQRLLAGGLRYASSHPGILIRPFTHLQDSVLTAAELEQWGAEGVFGTLEEEAMRKIRGALKPSVQIVNCNLTSRHPGVVCVGCDASTFLELAVGHLRHLGLRSFGILFTDQGRSSRDRLIDPFIALTKPTNSSLAIPVDHGTLMDPESNILPVPKSLAQWLRDLPKPTGVVCPCFGSGVYLIRCCAALGVKVPGQIAVMGCDDADLSLNCTPTLTSIIPGMEQLGTEAVRILAGMMEGHEPPAQIIRMKAMDLVIRESTGQRRSEVCDISGAMEYIQAKATSGIAVKQLIKETQRVSDPTFYSHFREATGKSPAQAIRDRQLEEARRLLTTTQLSVTMISQLAGFSSSNIMARHFHAVEGMTPRDYRKRSEKPDRGNNP